MDIVRKMRLGQLQGGGMTLLGLGQLCPAAKVLELPFLFNNYEEIDYVVMNKLRPGFIKLFEEKGVYMLGWYDMGFGYFFFKDPIRNFEDISKVKMVTFTGDPLFFEGEKVAGFENLIPLHISETITGLQTGLLTGTFSPFFALVGLQWNTHVKYVLNVPFSYSVAAMVIDKNFVDKMPPPYQKVLFEAMNKYESSVNQELRRMEKETYDSLLKRGLVEIPKDTAQEIVAEMKKRTRPLYEKLVDVYYPKWILAGILDALAQYRQGKEMK
ncbi:MAG: TRAP transporter substrate-binding protein DctP, partial [Proteobacteria bacterium]|nr:TRAP transporter substrate-binding protein DctP [Pseudomonadota bacterium]